MPDSSPLSPYRDLRDRDLRNTGLFICEGRNLVLRLLASSWKTESVLCDSRWAEEFRDAAGGRCPVLEMDKDELSRLTGFPFHRGVLACGRREPLPPVAELTAELPDARTVVVLPDLTNQENVGGIIRTADALGADAVILGGRCADPFGRKALKASMGSVFTIPLFCSASPSDTTVLKSEGFTLAGAVTSRNAVPVTAYARPGKLAVLIGGEAEGLSASWLEVCSVGLTIPMKTGIDSLNAATAAGIILDRLGS